MTQLALALPISVLQRNRGEPWDSKVYFTTDTGQWTGEVYIQLSLAWVGRGKQWVFLAPQDSPSANVLGSGRVQSTLALLAGAWVEASVWCLMSLAWLAWTAQHISHPGSSQPNNSCQFCVWQNETFRKSSWGYPEMAQIKKQTNKQTNKQLFRSTISQLNHVPSLQNFQTIFLEVSQDDSNEKNISTNKQTN